MTSRIQNQLSRVAAVRGAVGTAYVQPPVKSYTDACEAPQAMWDGAIPLRTRRAEVPASSSSAGTLGEPSTQQTQRTFVVEKTYNHPKETLPSDLTLNHVNAMYTMGNNDLLRMFPEGLGGKVMQLMPPGHPRGFLYRSQSHLLNTYISKLPHWKAKREGLRTLTNGTPGFIVDGPTGSGKSALMCQAVHYARARNITTIYIPNASAWSHGEWCWPATTLPGFFDVPDATRSFLQYFSRAHTRTLKDWQLRVTPKDLPTESGESVPKSLFDLCTWGYTAPAPSSIDRQSVALKYVLDELMAETEKPILFVVDGMNLLSQDTHFRYPHPDFWRQLQSFAETDIDMYPQELPRIPASRLTLMRGLSRIQHNILGGSAADANKFFVTCTTRNFKPFDGISGFDEPDKDKTATMLDEYAPFYPEKDTLLHPIILGDFDDYEYRSFMRFVVNSGELAGLGWGPLWHFASGFERKLGKIDFLSGRNPQRAVDHYHGELVWKTEYQRLRQKQYLLNRGSALVDDWRKNRPAARPAAATVARPLTPSALEPQSSAATAQ